MRWRIIVIVLMLVCAAVGFALGAQVWRFSRCQQLAAQYAAALAPVNDLNTAAAISGPLIEQTRDAYQQECG